MENNIKVEEDTHHEACVNRGMLFTRSGGMEKIKNGDPVIYKDRKGIVYGKPRENKYRGIWYTVKIGDDYVKATPGELKLENDTEQSPIFPGIR